VVGIEIYMIEWRRKFKGRPHLFLVEKFKKIFFVLKIAWMMAF